MVRHIWALGKCNWNISHDILIPPILSKARWWKFLCTLCRQIFVHSTCLDGGLKIQFLIILNAACNALGFWVFFSFHCIFNLYLNWLIKRELKKKVIWQIMNLVMNVRFLIVHGCLSSFQAVGSCDSAVEFFTILASKTLRWKGNPLLR